MVANGERTRDSSWLVFRRRIAGNLGLLSAGFFACCKQSRVLSKKCAESFSVIISDGLDGISPPGLITEPLNPRLMFT